MATKKQNALLAEEGKLQTGMELNQNEATPEQDLQVETATAQTELAMGELESKVRESNPSMLPAVILDKSSEAISDEITGDKLEASQTESEKTTDEKNPDEELAEKLTVDKTYLENTSDEKTDGQTEIKQVKKPRRRLKTGDAQSQSSTEEIPLGGDDIARQAPTKRRAAPKFEAVMSIDAQRTVETEADKAKNDLLDLLESLKTGRILAGTIQGVERTSDNQSMAVIYHGAFKVIVPAEEAVDPPADFRGQSPADVFHYMLTKRLGAEVDYVVKGIDQSSGVAVASRLEAMKAKRKQYYFGTDREGNNLLYVGACAESRVVSVIRAGVFIDLFGLEIYIPLKELSYQRMMDATILFRPGQRILVKILEIDRSDRNHIKAIASVKQAGENPYEKALRRYTVDNRYVGTVSMVDTNGVFVALDGGIDCLCSYPKRGRPPRGARVTVRILGINHETNRIWGAITHISTPG